jgi:hypothetical protein
MIFCYIIYIIYIVKIYIINFVLCIIYWYIEGKIEVKGIQGIRRKQLLDNLKVKRKH